MRTLKENEQKLTAYKAFDENFQCRGFQFEVGKTYYHIGKIKICESGFHSCEDPLDVLNYYDVCTSRFAEVICPGVLEKHSEDSKVVSSTIEIIKELSLSDFITKSFQYLTNELSGHSSTQAASGYYSKQAASGKDCVSVSAGQKGKVKTGTNGAFALTWWSASENRFRIVVGYEGENGIKADTWYTLSKIGEIVEAM